MNRNIWRSRLFGVLTLALFPFQPPEVHAAPPVAVERLPVAETHWNFKTVPRPSKSDAATGVKVEFVGNVAEAAGSAPDVLTDGFLPLRANQPKGFAFFTNQNAEPGSMLMDLGRVISIAQINSYSWHEHPPSQSCRAPQVYSVYGSAAEKPDPKNPALKDWTKLADVDTRPNATGENWGGQHGVSIGDARHPLGSFRWLLWVCRPTLSPKERPGFTHSFFCELDVHTPETLAKAGDAEIAGSRVKEVVVVFKTHFDIGYTDMARNIVEKYRTTMIDQALAVVDQNRDLPPEQQFAWTIPGWPMHQILDWPRQTPERKRRVLQAFKDGRFVVHALPYTTHTETLELEDLVRGLGFAARVSREAGLPLPRDAKMTDVPEHTWAMATILGRAGVKFMHIGCNSMSASPRVPPLYWWEGPDGSRVLTMYSPNYGTGLFPPDDWPYRTWLALQHTGDNHGPPRPEEVKKILGLFAERMPGVKVRIGRLSDFGDAILAENPTLPVVHGDTPDTWIHGPMSDPAGMKIVRNVRPMIAATELLNTQLRAWNQSVPDPAAQIATAYEQSLMYGEHTWGGSIGWLHGRFGFGEEFAKERAAGRFKRIEESWDEHTAYAEKMRDVISPVLATNLQALAQAVDVPGPRVVVFNPLPWKRDGIVKIGATEILARDVPASGYRTLELGRLPEIGGKVAGGKLAANERNATIENDTFAAALDPRRGVIRSLVDKRTGRELVDADSPVGLGQYLYERFDDRQVNAYADAYIKINHGYRLDFVKPGLPANVPYSATSPRDFKLRFETTPVSVAAVMDSAATAGLPAVTTRLVLYRGQNYSDLEITVHDKPVDSWPEAGWLCLPFKIGVPQFRLGRVGSIIDPAKDIVPNSNRDLFVLNTGLTMTDPQGRGVGLCPMDHPVVSLGEPGCWKFSKEEPARKPVVFVNLFNNQWNTNFRLWNGGTWTSRVRIWAVENANPEPSLITPSLEARCPLLAVQAGSCAGASNRLPLSREGVSLSRRGAMVTAFGPNPGGASTLLRVWEQAGISGKVAIKLPEGMKAARAVPVNLRGEKTGDPVAVASGDRSAIGDLIVDLPAFSPASFLLEP